MKELIELYFYTPNSEASEFREKYLSKEYEKVSPIRGREVSPHYRAKLKEALKTGEIKNSNREVCFCGGTDLFKLSAKDRFGLEYGTFICKACGLIFTSPHIAAESLAEYYRYYYHPIHIGKGSLADENKLLTWDGQGEKIFQLVRPVLGETDSLNVLEVGAGLGNVLNEFKSAASGDGITVNELATEYNQECIAQCRNNGIRVLEGSIAEVIATGQQFDLIILSHVFEHFIDLRAAIASIEKLLKPGGFVYVEVPGLFELHNKREYNFEYIKFCTHAHTFNFTLATLTNVFNTCGFKLIIGNEEVEALFQTGQQDLELKNNYNSIIDYLYFLEYQKSGRAAVINEKERELALKADELNEKEQALKLKTEELSKKAKELALKNSAIARQTEEVLNLRTSYSYRVGYHLLHPYKIPRMLYNRLKLLGRSCYSKAGSLFSKKRDIVQVEEGELIFNFLKDLTPPGVMVDVGAHYGSSLRKFAQFGWEIFAFEPDPHNRRKLNQLLREYIGVNVRVEEYAVTDRDSQKMKLYRSEVSSGISGLSSFHKTHQEIGEVETITLRKYCSENSISKINFLKIDTEGFDKFVLEGFPWEEMRPDFIICEFEDRKTVPLGYNFHDLVNFLIEKKYKIIISEWNPIVEYGTKHSWLRFGLYPHRLNSKKAWGNIIAIRDEDDFNKFKVGILK